MEAITARNDGTPSRKVTAGLERRRLLKGSVRTVLAGWVSVRACP